MTRGIGINFQCLLQFMKGMPTLAVGYIKPEVQVWIQSENGILGMGPYPTEDKIDV